MKRIVAAVAAAGLAAGLMAAAPAASADPGVQFSPAPIAWGPCASASLKAAGAECGFLEVPMDYAKPGGAKVSSRCRGSSTRPRSPRASCW